jgi:hypothetical protein
LHQIVLGEFSPRFRELFVFHSGWGDILSFPFVFPFPTVLTNLITLFYAILIPTLIQIVSYQQHISAIVLSYPSVLHFVIFWRMLCYCSR